MQRPAPAEQSAAPGARGSLRRWTLAALGVFALATALVYQPVWRAGIGEVVPASAVFDSGAERTGFWVRAAENDALFAAWLVARNAHTLTRRPHRLFDAEHCAPAERTLALGEPMITLGLLGIPARLLGAEPAATYNAALALQSLAASLAMYLLVAEWTGVPAAGIAAGLLYAFDPARLRNITHPFIHDTTGTVLALLFARRLFARGRWRDALGLAASAALQLGGSFYPLLAAAFLAVPFALWLLLRYRLRCVRPAQLALAVALAGGAAVLLLGPYLAVHRSAELGRSHQYFAGWPDYLPGGPLSPTLGLIALGAAGLVLGRRRAAAGIGGDPRWALAAGALLAVLAAAGPSAPWPDLYSGLAAVVPGLGSVRAVEKVAVGLHLVLCILAGMGAAGILRPLAGRRRRAAAAVLVALVAVEGLRPAALGLEPRHRFNLVAARPHPEHVAFFAELARRGDAGPLLELPIDARVWRTRAVAPRRILLTAYHGRRTSACFGSFAPPGRAQLEEWAWRLPEPEAVRGLHGLGFHTVVLHHRGGPPRAHPLVVESQRPGGALRPLHASDGLSAYRLVPEPGV